VEWFNAVDATYRADLREFNELNFARFDAKVEQRFAQTEAKFEQRLAHFEVKFEQRIAQSEVKFEQRLADTRSELRTEIAHSKVQVISWMVGLWLTSVMGVAGVLWGR
jgi:hypothetical protein